MKNKIGIEKEINKIYGGLRVHILDVDLEEEDMKRYRKDKVFSSKGPITMTSLIEGMDTSHRYIILSSQENIYLGEDVKSKELGIKTIGISYFKVLDTFKIDNNKIIVLLDLQTIENYDLFKKTNLDLDKEIIERLKDILSVSLSKDAKEELAYYNKWFYLNDYPI